MATLSKMGVPLGGGTGRGGILQPKMKNHFRVRFFNFGPIAGGIEMTQMVMTCSRPSRTQSSVTVHSYNSIGYYAGKAEWGTMECTLRDDVTNTVRQLVAYQEQKQLNHFEQTMALAGSNYQFDVYLEAMDGGNDGVIEQIYAEGCFLETVNYGDYDYSTGEPMTIGLTIRPNNITETSGLMPDTVDFTTGLLV